MKLVGSLVAALLLLTAPIEARSLNRFKIIDNAILGSPQALQNIGTPEALQNIVTWDDKSLFIRGERIMIFSGEFHPFRLPVPSLWLDVFQKIKALGMNTVSFYVDWALLEGKERSFSAKGPLALEPFFDAAKQAGLYLIARPGPYINAEVSGGGFPGWLQRLNATLRTKDPAYLKATSNYLSHVTGAIAAAQITEGGPVILYQPENEYTNGATGHEVEYMQDVIDQARKAGIVVPMINNDPGPGGDNAPGTGVGAADIYGHDAYFFSPDDCAKPDVWPAQKLPTNFRQLHMQQSPTTPYSIVEFQAGCALPWGGTTYDQCAALLDASYERVFYKNDISFGVAILNLYMTAGGTNWGNLGYPEGFTSYDYGSAITEGRTVDRTKYSELKLIANFLKASPSYLDASPKDQTRGQYTQTTDLTVTPLIGSKKPPSSFYVVRHTNYASTDVTNYKFNISTSQGKRSIPQLGGTLSLHGRDSKIHLVDYPLGDTTLTYSSAELFTWKKFDDQVLLVVYGGAGEMHEIEVQLKGGASVKVIEGRSMGVQIKRTHDAAIISWTVHATRYIVRIGNLYIYMLERADAYNYWVPELSSDAKGPGFSTLARTKNSIIVKASYLVRSAYVNGSDLHIEADFNASTIMEIIGAPSKATQLVVNGRQVHHSELESTAAWTANISYETPNLNLPDLQSLEWKYVDTLPEVKAGYNDSAWPDANLQHTYNTLAKLSTPTSLFGGDYGFNTGYLLFRGSFTANGNESRFTVETQGGTSFASSVWLDSRYLGSWKGNAVYPSQKLTLELPKLTRSTKHTLTVLVDQNGFEEDGQDGDDYMKTPRGILTYSLKGHKASEIKWKITGNLDGEDYRDRVRGPLNEGGLYAERHGWHQPKPPRERWATKSPITTGIQGAGVGFFSANFSLDIPKGYDVPLYFTFSNTTSPPASYRVQLYVNGYQFGKYSNDIGPQKSFIVPEGILNYRGRNWVALTLWSLQNDGAKLDGLNLTAGTPVQTSYQTVELVDMPPYKRRKGAY